MADIDSPEFRARFMQHQLLAHNAAGSADKPALIVAEGPLSVNVDIDELHDATDVPNDSQSSCQNAPVSQPRTVILSCLPPGTTLTLVQALIHSGKVEELALNESRSTAHVTFTTASELDKYCNTHPEGFIAFQFKAWQYAVLLHKHTNVNEDSHIENGTTRVLKVTGVDSHWSIDDLKALSEGRENARKVEAIIITYNYDVCSVDFRFAKISDAISFHAQLAEDASWKCVTFGTDPCEIAAGIHLED